MAGTQAPVRFAIDKSRLHCWIAALLPACLAVLLTGCAGSRTPLTPEAQARQEATFRERCKDRLYVLVMAENPPQMLAGTERGNFDGTDRPVFYQWLFSTFGEYAEGWCLVSPEAAFNTGRQLGVSLDTAVLNTRAAPGSTHRVKHLPWDDGQRQRLYDTAAALGVHYIVVARWIEGGFEDYRRSDISAQGLRTTTVSGDVVATWVRVAATVHDVRSRAPVFQKEYMAFEERIALFGLQPQRRNEQLYLGDRKLRKAIAASVVEDVRRIPPGGARAAAETVHVDSVNLEPKVPIVIDDRRQDGDRTVIYPALQTLERKGKFTLISLAFVNPTSGEMRVSLARRRVGVSSFAKAASGATYQALSDASQRDAMRLRPGERGVLNLVISNELGPLGQVTLYSDVEVRTNRSNGIYRLTFDNVTGP
jgi:hypothetical protein